MLRVLKLCELQICNSSYEGIFIEPLLGFGGLKHTKMKLEVNKYLKLTFLYLLTDLFAIVLIYAFLLIIIHTKCWMLKEKHPVLDIYEKLYH